jgi:C4-dicarboxylate-specific signal transduction histidine kinase
MNLKWTHKLRRAAVQCLAAGAVLAVLSFVAIHLHANEAEAGMVFFVFIILFSLWADLPSVILMVTVADLTYDYFFTPPLFSFDFSMGDPIDIVAWFSYVGAAIIITRLVSGLRKRGADFKQANDQLRGEMAERKRVEDAYSRAQAELAHITRVMTMGELTASIAHEINQPLSGVMVNGKTCLRWLAGDPPNLEEARESATLIVRDGKRAADIIARIRALATRSETTKERLDLNEVIEDIVDLARNDIIKRQVNLRMALDKDLWPVSADRVEMQQVLLNLVRNGVEAMSGVEEEARELVIKTKNEAGGHVRIAVRDSGSGVAAENMERVFDAFFTTKDGGMGMGLSICRTIIQSHEGRLWAAANDGPGTTFQFTIPREP